MVLVILIYAFRLQLSYHKFNEIQREQTVLKRLKEGEIVALISDAGMPGISDPGTELVRIPSPFVHYFALFFEQAMYRLSARIGLY